MLRHKVFICLGRTVSAPLQVRPAGRLAVTRCLRMAAARTCSAPPPGRESRGAAGETPRSPSPPPPPPSGGPADHSTPQADYSGPQADHSGPQADHGGPQADHSRPQADHSGPQADHGGPQADRSGPYADESEPPPGAAEAELKTRVLEAGLAMVPELGWSTEALAAGAESLGLPDVSHGLFPRGGVELVGHFYTSCNARLVAQMADRRAAEESADLSARLGSQAFIRWAVEQRLRMVTPYLSRWPEALGLLALPGNVPTSLANFGALLDDIWYHAGDRSSDFNWYTKRGILAAVYKATELRLLTDSSEDFSETWAFLDRRLEDAVSAGRCVRQLREAAPQAGHTATVLVNTVTNMAGLNSRR